MHNKIFVDIFISLLQKIVLCRCLKRFFLNKVAAILTFAVIATLKMKTYLSILSTLAC